MAKKGYGFADRFPHFGIFFVIALTLAIPLTVWSLRNTPTNFTQQAQALKCGPSNQNPSCPTNFQCNFINNNSLLGGTCSLNALNAPINLKSSATCKYNQDSPNIAVFNLSWDNVGNATSYKIYGDYSYFNTADLANINVGPYITNTNKHTLTIPLPHGVKFFYWYVRAYNEPFKATSPMSIRPAIIINCN
jgi:hypothetical protein